MKKPTLNPIVPDTMGQTNENVTDSGLSPELTAVLEACPSGTITEGSRVFQVRHANLLVLLSEGLLPAPLSAAVEEMYYGSDESEAETPVAKPSKPTPEKKKKEFELFLKAINLLFIDPHPLQMSIAEIQHVGMKLLMGLYDQPQADAAKK